MNIVEVSVVNHSYSRKLILGLIVSVIAFVSGISYAFFTATFNNVGNRDTSITSASVGSIRLNAEAATYTSENQYPGEMTVQKFYIEPVGEGKGIYELDLTAVLPSVFGSDIEISLYKTINNEEVTVTKGELVETNSGANFNYSRVDTLNTDGLTPVYQGILKNGENILIQEDFEVINQSGLKIRENSSSTAYSRYTYYLVYNYKNNGSQNNQMGQTFSGTISVKLIGQKTPVVGPPIHLHSYVGYSSDCLNFSQFEPYEEATVYYNSTSTSFLDYDHIEGNEGIMMSLEGYLNGNYYNTTLYQATGDLTQGDVSLAFLNPYNGTLWTEQNETNIHFYVCGG